MKAYFNNDKKLVIDFEEETINVPDGVIFNDPDNVVFKNVVIICEQDNTHNNTER